MVKKFYLELYLEEDNFKNIKEKQMSSNTGKEFIEKTKYKYLDASDQTKGLAPPPVELKYDNKSTIINLPSPKEIIIKDKELREVIENRRSIRSYSNKPLSIDELSYLLWCVYGVKEVVSGYNTLRTVPSAGARHAFEIYLLVNNVDNLSKGIYRFIATKHKLVEILKATNIANDISNACLGQEFIKSSAVTIFWVAVPYRMNWRYSERGYRYLLLDAGHSCQNLYLGAESIDCGVCAIAAFSDDDLNRVLDFDGEEQFVIYLATVGKK